MMHCDTIAWVSPQAILHNLAAIRARVGEQTALCVAVKANAYGHDIRIVLPVLERTGVSMVAVASLDEAVEVRSLGWPRGILWLGSGLSCASGAPRVARIEAVLANNVTVSPTRTIDLEDLNTAAGRMGRPAGVHINVETGMGRLGLNPDDALALCKLADRLDHLRLEGIYTHLATADERDQTYARLQLAAFDQFRSRVCEAGLRPRYYHAANSAASLCLPEARYDLVRPGLAVYGYRPAEVMPEAVTLLPAMRVTSRITLIKTLPPGAKVGYGSTYTAQRNTRVAVVGVGYNDGYLRRLSNRAVMTVADRYAPVIGRISMDQTTLDVTDIPAAQIGSEVTVIDDRADRPNSVEGLARLLDTIPYEITCLLGPRIERRATDADTTAARAGNIASG